MREEQKAPMSASLLLTLVIVVAAPVVATAVVAFIARRSPRPPASQVMPDDDFTDLGLSRTGPTVLHFSAPHCGPCAATRRVVDQVCGELPGVAHIEINIDENPAAAQRFSVLSLPTTVIFDADGRPRFRADGVPKAADLRAALQPLLT